VQQATCAANFIPAQQLAGIEEPAAHNMARRMQRVALAVPSLPVDAVEAAFVGPSDPVRQQHRKAGTKAPVVLLHGFNNSSLEWRRLYPLLEKSTETWAIDLLGRGFSDYSVFMSQPDLPFGPQQKREHLYSFWKEMIGRPMVLTGSSLGGALAIDFALHHPEAVEKLVLINAVGLTDGMGPVSRLPHALTPAMAWLLQSDPLTMAANKKTYHNSELATMDAWRVARLHHQTPGWSNAMSAWIKSGGYSISSNIPQVVQPTLVLWGRQDQILTPAYAERFDEMLQDAELRWLEGCGHAGHLEKPEEVAAAILEFATCHGAGEAAEVVSVAV